MTGLGNTTSFPADYSHALHRYLHQPRSWLLCTRAILRAGRLSIATHARLAPRRRGAFLCLSLRRAWHHILPGITPAIHRPRLAGRGYRRCGEGPGTSGRQIRTLPRIVSERSRHHAVSGWRESRLVPGPRWQHTQRHAIVGGVTSGSYDSATLRWYPFGSRTTYCRTPQGRAVSCSTMSAFLARC